MEGVSYKLVIKVFQQAAMSTGCVRYVRILCVDGNLSVMVGSVLLQEILYIAKGIQPCHTGTLDINSVYEGP